MRRSPTAPRPQLCATLSVPSDFAATPRNVYVGLYASLPPAGPPDEMVGSFPATSFATSHANLGVFDVAAEVGVPVLLHTGFSPFPGTRSERDYYDPARLASVVEAYDGTRGAGRVDFVLSHVGQGDARAVAAALDLAERFDNVWLEVSALGNPIAIDALGMPTTGGSPQLPDVMQQIKTRGLTSRALFASDGPQFSGKVRSYLNDVIEAAQAANWSSDELRGLLAENFERLYLE